MNKTFLKTKLIFLLIAVISLFCGTINTFANDINIYLNGEIIPPLEYQHQGAIIENETLYLPLRNIFEAIGATVIYDDEDNIEIVHGGIGKVYFKNVVGEEKLQTENDEFALTNATFVKNNRILIVKEALTYIFNADVNYTDDSVYIEYEECPDIFELDFSNIEMED